MRMICEITEDVKVIEEAKEDGKKSLYIEGIFLAGGVKNRNGRYYPVEVLQKEAKRYTDMYINANRAYGELGHPEGPQINLDRVSHLIKSIRQEGNNFIGRAKITEETPMGRIAAALIREGANLGVSSRGLGSLKEKDGIMEVQDDFMLSTAADIVSDPSAPGAFVKGIYEQKEWLWENGIWKEVDLVKAREEIKSSTQKKLDEGKALEIWNRLMESFVKTP